MIAVCPGSRRGHRQQNRRNEHQTQDFENEFHHLITSNRRTRLPTPTPLRTSKLDPYFFRETLSNLGGQPVMHMARSKLGHIDHHRGRRSSDRHDQPDQRGKGEPSERAHFEPESMARPKISDHRKSQQKHSSGRRSEHDQGDVDDTVELLATAAVLATGEMQLVVAAHLRSQARNIVAPSRKDFPYNRFHAVIHKWLHRSKYLQPDGFENVSL